MVAELKEAWAQQDEHRERLDLGDLRSTGTIVTLEAAPCYYLKTQSLERFSRHRDAPRPMWRLLSVHSDTDTRPERAQVWIADDYRDAFIKRFQEFLNVETPNGNPRNAPLVANIGHIHAATLEDLWRSTGRPPKTGTHWWEVRLHPTIDALDQALAFAHSRDLVLTNRAMRFGRRSVVWFQARWADLKDLPLTSVPIAELRRPAVVDTIEDLELADQHDYVFDLVDNVDEEDQHAAATCLLIEARVIFADVVNLDDSWPPDEEETEEEE